MSAWGTSFQETGAFSLILALTRRSISVTCSGVRAAEEKSKRRRSGATSDPCWVGVGADDFVEGPVEEVGGGVVGFDAAAAGGVHGKGDLVVGLKLEI